MTDFADDAPQLSFRVDTQADRDARLKAALTGTREIAGEKKADALSPTEAPDAPALAFKKEMR